MRRLARRSRCRARRRLVAAAACDDGVPAERRARPSRSRSHGGQFISGAAARARLRPRLGAPTARRRSGARPSASAHRDQRRLPERASSSRACAGQVVRGPRDERHGGRRRRSSRTLGTGYWVVPIQGHGRPDFPGQSDFGFSLSFNADDPPGNADLLTSSRIDANGNAGHAGRHAHLHRVARPGQRARVHPEEQGPRGRLHAAAGTPTSTSTCTSSSPDGTRREPEDRRHVGRRSTPGQLPRRRSVASTATRSATASPTAGARRTSSSRTPRPRHLHDLRRAVRVVRPGGRALHLRPSTRPARDGNLHATFTRSGELLANDATGGGVDGPVRGREDLTE